MNGRIDVIEVLRLANPVTPDSIDEQADLSAERRASLRVVPTEVPVTGPGADAAHGRRRWPRYVAAVGAVAAGVAAFILIPRSEDRGVDVATTSDTAPGVSPPSTVGAIPPTSVVDPGPRRPAVRPFVGVWVSADTDGSSQTMEILHAGGDEYEVVVRNDAAAACSGVSSTMTGTGRLETLETLVIAQPVVTCDDGTTSAIGPPPQEDIANFTLVRDAAKDELGDQFGVVWRREGAATENVSTTADTEASSETDAPYGTLPGSATPLPDDGALAPGSYALARDGVADYQRLIFTLPAGWAISDGLVHKHLNQVDEVAFSVWTGVRVYDDPCNWQESPRGELDLGDEQLHDNFHDAALGSTVPKPLHGGLANQLGRNASELTRVEVGGEPTLKVELSVPAEIDLNACDQGQYRSWTGVSTAGGANAHHTPGQIDVVYMVDLDRGPLVIDASHMPATSAADLAELEAILASMIVDRGP